jgi:hypothetical protein
VVYSDGDHEWVSRDELYEIVIDVDFNSLWHPDLKDHIWNFAYAMWNEAEIQENFINDDDN